MLCQQDWQLCHVQSRWSGIVFQLLASIPHICSLAFAWGVYCNLFLKALSIPYPIFNGHSGLIYSTRVLRWIYQVIVLSIATTSQPLP
jgi:Zn-dependent protease